MRKASKSRADDDLNSSTGSVANEAEEQLETDDPPAAAADADEDQPDADEDDAPKDRQQENGKKADESEDDYEPSPKKPKSKSKKKGAKSTAKKRKSERVAEAEAKGDEDEDDNDEEEEEYEVEKVVGSKKIKGKQHYLIRWKGYSADSDTWEPENTLSCPELISKYKEKDEGSAKPSPKIKISLKKKGRPSKGKKGAKPSPAKKSKKSEEWDGENADESAEYEVERILEVHHKKSGSREFLIHWKGWSTKFDSWEPEEHLNCADMIAKFMAKVESAKSAGSKELRVAPQKANRFTLAQRSTGRRLSKRRGQSQRVRYDDAE